jgi:hypothetical protein
LPDLEDVEEASSCDRLGDPGIGNFVGFTCLDRTSQLQLDSEESEGESLLTPALRTAGSKTATNPDSEVSESENVMTPAQKNASTKTTTNFRDSVSVKPIHGHETECAAPNSYGKVIIIEPLADTHLVDKFFSNDLTLSKALADSLFARAGIAGFSKNLGRKILVSFERELRTGMSSLLNINWFASWTIKCCLPVNFARSVCVIGPLGEDVLNEDLAEALVLAGHRGTMVERILKRKDKSNTSMFSHNQLKHTANIHLPWVSALPGKPLHCHAMAMFYMSKILPQCH